MEGGHHQGAALLKENAVLLGDLQIRLDQLLPGDPPQAHQDLGPQQGELVAQVANAGFLLLRQGVPVLGRPALDDVGDVHVGVPVQVYSSQHLVQQLATPAHKGFPLQVFVFAGAFPHKHHLGLGVPHAKHHVVAGFAQPALPAGKAGFFQFVPMVQHSVLLGVNFFFYCSTAREGCKFP